MELSNDSISSIMPQDTQLVFSDERLTTILNPIRAMISTIAIMGSLANLTSMVVFCKMGLTSTTNICFFSLSISDCASLVYLFILATVYFVDTSSWKLTPPVVIDALLVQVYLVTSTFGSWVTTVISIERCCCVAFPLQVKRIFTKDFVAILLLVFMVFQVAAAAPYYTTFHLISVTVPGSNRTRVVVDRATLDIRMVNIIRFVSYAVPTCICFSLVIVATIFLIKNLNRSRKKREAMTSDRTATATDSEKKELRIAKSVIFICTFYILGYFINVTKYFVSLRYPTIDIHDPIMGNITTFVTTISILLQSISFSANFFIYLRMNSKYRSTLFSLFGATLSNAGLSVASKSA